jgi:hypothetical protein
LIAGSTFSMMNFLKTSLVADMASAQGSLWVCF